MDDKEFRRILDQVAEWRWDKVSATEIAKGRKMAKGKYKPVVENEPEPEMAVTLIDGVNPTTVPVLVCLKPCATTCEDCGLHCANGREVTAKRYPAQRNQPAHWRKRCVTCQRYLHKVNGTYSVPDNSASAHYLGVNPKHNVAFENDREIITIHCEKTPQE